MGVTYRAFDTKLKVEVVLKLIHPEVLQNERIQHLFLREARAAAKVRHPNIAAVITLHDEPPFYYAMEFVDGAPLSAVLKSRGALSLAEALDFADQIAAALGALAREHIVHRDLKPANLMLLPDEERRFGSTVKLIDFGLAKGFSTDGEEVESYLASSLSQSSVFSGTPYYASPEQCATGGDLDTRSDLYSLGIILWEMLSAKRPFTGPLGQVLAMHQFKEPPWDQLRGVPEPVMAILRRLLAKERDARFQTPRELRDAFAGCFASEAALDRHEGKPGAAGVPTEGGAAPGTETIRLGSTLAARFQVGEEVAEGDGGKLYRAVDISRDSQVVALKLLTPQRAQDEVLSLALERQLAQMRAHPHPVVLAQAGGLQRSGESTFLVRDWAAGFSLLELLRARRELNAPEIWQLLGELPPAIDHAAQHHFTLAEPLLRKLFVEPSSSTASAVDWPSLRTRSLEQWPEFHLRWNALSIRAAGQSGTNSLTQAASEGPSVTEEPVVALALLVRALLGGSPGLFSPLPALRSEANAILHRALSAGGGSLAFGGAVAFWNALQEASGSSRPAPYPPAPLNLPPLPAPIPAPAPPPPAASPALARIETRMANLAPIQPSAPASSSTGDPGRGKRLAAIVAVLLAVGGAATLVIHALRSDPDSPDPNPRRVLPASPAAPAPVLASDRPSVPSSQLNALPTSAVLPSTSTTSGGETGSHEIAKARTERERRQRTVLPLSRREIFSFAVVDMNRTFEGLSRTKDAEAQINQARTAAKKTMDERVDARSRLLERISALAREVERGSATAARERDDLTTQVRALEKEIAEFKSTKEKQLQEQAVQLRNGLVEEITRVVLDGARQQGVACLFDRSGSSLNGVPFVLYHGPTIPDWTDAIIAAVNQPGRRAGAKIETLRASSGPWCLATIDASYVFSALPETKSAETELNATRATAKRELDERTDRRASLQAKVTELEAQLSTSSGPTNERARGDLAKARDALQTEDAALASFKEQREKKIKDDSTQKRNAIVAKMNAACAALARRKGVDVFFDFSAQSLNGVAILLTAPGLPDLSDELIAALSGQP